MNLELEKFLNTYLEEQTFNLIKNNYEDIKYKKILEMGIDSLGIISLIFALDELNISIPLDLNITFNLIEEALKSDNRTV